MSEIPPELYKVLTGLRQTGMVHEAETIRKFVDELLIWKRDTLRTLFEAGKMAGILAKENERLTSALPRPDLWPKLSDREEDL